METPTQRTLSDSDHAFIRVLDDLIAVLIDKQVIAIDDLPKPAREKYQARHKLRFELQGLDELLAEAEDEDEDESQ